VSRAEQSAGGAEFKVLNTEQSVTRSDSWPAQAQRAASGAIRKQHRASSNGCRVKSASSAGWMKWNAEQFAGNSGSQVSSAERSATGANAKCGGRQLGTISTGVTQRVLTSVVERETTQTNS